MSAELQCFLLTSCSTSCLDMLSMDSNIDTNASGFTADPQRNTIGTNVTRLDAERNLVQYVYSLVYCKKHVIYGLMFDLWKL